MVKVYNCSVGIRHTVGMVLLKWHEMTILPVSSNNMFGLLATQIVSNMSQQDLVHNRSNVLTIPGFAPASSRK